MKRMIIGATMLALVSSTALVAQPGQNRDRNQQHEGRQWHEKSGRWDNGRHRGWGNERARDYRWGRGDRMGYYNWRNAERIDYRRFHLRQPPRGYEWRRSNGRFVLVAVRTGLIVSVVIYPRR